jgi:hypothetical protein
MPATSHILYGVLMRHSKTAAAATNALTGKFLIITDNK